MEVTFNLPRQTIRVQTIFEDIELPKTVTPLSIGHDFYAPKTVCLEKMATLKICTGIKMQLPPHLWMQIHPRSSYACRGISVEGGIIDSDYRGEITVIVRNLSNDRFVIKKGERFCQGVFHPAIRVNMKKIDNVDTNTMRGTGGLGSSGK